MKSWQRIKRSPGTAGQLASPGQQGYVLVFFLFLATMLVIGLYRVLPQAAFEGQRQKEEELVFRGMQYQRAIRLFVRQFGRYPTSLDELTNTNNMRFIRKLYPDPMTKDGSWRLIHMGPGGVLLDSINPPVTQNCIGNSASSGGNASSGNSNSGSESSANSASGSSNSTGGSGSSGCPSNSATGSSVTSGSSGTGASTSGSSPFTTLQPSSQGGANPNPNSSYQAPVTGQQPNNTGQPGTSDQSQSASSLSSGQFGSGTIAGPIAGVASKSEAKSIRVWNTYTQYNHWEFVYNYLATAGVMPGAGAAGAPSNPAASQAPSAQPQSGQSPAIQGGGATPSAPSSSFGFPGTLTTPSPGNSPILP